MSEAAYVEMPVIQWMCGEQPTPYRAGRSLGWTYRDETAMAAFDRPLDDPLVEKLLIPAILRISSHVKTEAQAKLAGAALRKTMSHPDRLTANRQTLDLLRDGAKVALNPGEEAQRGGFNYFVRSLVLLAPLAAFVAVRGIDRRARSRVCAHRRAKEKFMDYGCVFYKQVTPTGFGGKAKFGRPL